MDIQYLLWLQEFRNGAGAFLTDFMLKISTISEMVTSLAIVAVISIIPFLGNCILTDIKRNSLRAERRKI